jgi:predicted ATPase/class 3 adenylate cyclase
VTDLPNGTVTFLFTDVEGSTRLLGEHPAAYHRGVTRHHALLRQAVEAHHGVVFETVGDAVYGAFALPSDAVAAALEGQLALQAEDWGELGAIRVRMALHTGDVERQGDHYFGVPLYRCGRLLSTAHGGQVVLSSVTAALVQDALPRLGASLRDLGMCQLRDLQVPERIFQLLHRGLPTDFPPLRGLASRAHNLPAPATPFVDRERAVEVAQEVLLRPEVRLLTLTGTGGVGKTRLALQVAAGLLDAFDGAYFVSLGPLGDATLVGSAIARALGVPEAAGRPLPERLREYLSDKRFLLVLDNFEHVLDAALLVPDLMAAAPETKVLVTSRARLRLSGEQVLVLSPLTVPDLSRLPPVEELLQIPSVRLFAQRAQAVQPDLTLTDDTTATALAEICYRLEGLPLALELAAARVRLLSPPALLAHLQRRLPLLTGGPLDAPARQRALRSTLDWSYGLLGPAEQALFARLAVFAGGCALPAAERVSDGEVESSDSVLDGLASLIDTSLLQQEPASDAEPRYAMLETVREYGLERLEERGEADARRTRHAEYFVALAEEAEPALLGAQQRTWLDRLEADLNNVRAALRWCAERGLDELGLRLAGSLWRFWELHGYYAQGHNWLETMLAQADGVAPAIRARALNAAGKLSYLLGDTAASRARYEAALALAEALDERRAVATALLGLGQIANVRREPDTARDLLTRSLELQRASGDRWGASRTLYTLGQVATNQGDYDAAQALCEESLAISRELGDHAGTAWTLNLLGVTASRKGDFGGARRLYAEYLRLSRELGDRRGVAMALNNLGNIARRQGDVETARALLEESRSRWRDLGDRWGETEPLVNLAHVARLQGDALEATALARESLARRWELGYMLGIPECLTELAGLAADVGQPEVAAHLLGAAEALRESRRMPIRPAERAEYDHIVVDVRERLDEPAFGAAWAAGRAQPLEQAVQEALAFTPWSPPVASGSDGSEPPTSTG